MVTKLWLRPLRAFFEHLRLFGRAECAHRRRGSCGRGCRRAGARASAVATRAETAVLLARLSRRGVLRTRRWCSDSLQERGAHIL